MDPVKLRFYTEIFEKDRKYFKLQEKFVATAQTKSLTSKFYAKHDIIPASDVKEEYVKLITKRMMLVPKDIYNFRPPSVNMEYGWFTDYLIPRTGDPRLYFPRREADFIANELYIRTLQKGLPVEKFVGIPFKV